MKQVRYNFSANFNNALRSGDYTSAQRIFADELADLVLINRFGIIEILRKSNISVPKNVTDKQIIALVVDNIDMNKPLAQGVGAITVQKNQAQYSALGVAEGVSFPANAERKEARQDRQDARRDARAERGGGDFLKNLGSAFGNIFGGITGTMQSKSELEAEKERTKQLALAALADKNKERKGSATPWIVGGILLAITTVVGIIIYRRNRK